MGTAGVSLVHYEGRQCIRKCHASDVEVAFYEEVAPQLTLLGVGIPELIACDNGILFLEFVPSPISLKQLIQTPETFKQLSVIHQFTLPQSVPLKVHSWSVQATDKALSNLSLPNYCHQILQSMRSQGQVLFKSSTLISGDSNDGNWGRRHNGELVLFDWERFGYGHPVIDLAPLVKGMGTQAEYEATAARYLYQNPNFELEDLARKLMLAKAWIAVEVVNILVETQNPMRQKYLDWYNATLPDWLEQMALNV